MNKHTFIKTALISLSFILICNICFAQNYEWAISIGDCGFDYSTSIAVDEDGNVFVTGSFDTIVDFDPGSGVANLTSNGNSDIFIAKYDNNGKYLWAKSMGGIGDDGAGGNFITTDPLGNVYVIGGFSFTVDFDPGSGTSNLTSNGQGDIFIAKYDKNGNYLWAKSIGAGDNDYINAISLDAAGNLYVIGNFYWTVDFDPGVGTADLTSNGYNDIFIAKYDNNGKYLWAKSMGSAGYDYGYSLDVDASGFVYVTGSFYMTVDFDPGLGTANITANNRDIFIAKYDNNGNYIWAKSMGGNNWDIGLSISVDSIGNSYVTGLFDDTADFDPGAGVAKLITNGSWDIFIAKYDTDGNYLWANNFGGYDADQGLNLYTDKSGEIYIIGSFKGTFIDFDPGSDYATLTSNGKQDIFIARYDADGNYIWAGSFGGSSWDVGNSIITDDAGNVYATGSFKDSVDFDFNNSIAYLASDGESDIFIVKYSKNITGITYLSNYPDGLEMLVYPNPSYGQLNIEINSPYQEMASLKIINLLGEEIYRESISINSSFQHQLDVSKFSKGVYFLILTTSGKIESQKIIVQ